MFMFTGTKKESTIDNTERIIAKLDSVGRARVEAVRKSRTDSVMAVRKASMERGTYKPCNDRITDQVIESAVRKEAKLQAIRLENRKRQSQDRANLRQRVRFERSEEYKKQCRDEIAKFSLHVLIF